MMLRTTRILVAASLFGGIAGQAQARCNSAAEQSAFDVGALKSELSVLATGCPGDEDGYNAFVIKDRSELLRADGVVNAWFKRSFGRAAQTHYDSYITLLANEQSLEGQHEGTDFCPRLKPVFDETMLVPTPQLAEYAAAKNVFPLDMACEISAAPGRVAEPAKERRRGHSKLKAARHKA